MMICDRKGSTPFPSAGLTAAAAARRAIPGSTASHHPSQGVVPMRTTSAPRSAVRRLAAGRLISVTGGAAAYTR